MVLKSGCTGSSESTHVKMPHCWKSHVTAHILFFFTAPRHQGKVAAKIQQLMNTLKVKINKTNSTDLYPPTKGYLRETCKSQNINPIYQTLSSPSVSFRSSQTPVKYVLVLNLIKSILTSAKFQYLTFKPNPRGQGCVQIQSVTLTVGLHFFHFNLICKMTTFRKRYSLTF